MGVSLLADLLLAGRRFQSISTEEPVMSKVLAVMIAGLFAVGAYAQGKETAQEASPPTNTKPQLKAQAKVATKTPGVKAQSGDQPKTAEGGAIGTDKAAVSGEKRAETRDTRRRNKDGSLKRRSTQGGTPQ
jgi:hypothetical protein